MYTEKSKEMESPEKGGMVPGDENFSSFDDFISNGEFLSGMHKVPQGFSHFVDISSNVSENRVAEIPEQYFSDYGDVADRVIIPIEDTGRTEAEFEAYPEAGPDLEAEKTVTGSRVARPARRNRNKSFYTSVIAVFCAFICLTGILTILIKDKEYSESENRVLAQKPVLSITTLTNGSFMKDFETYLTDQFPLRDSAITLKTFVDRLIGVQKENGVYIGKDGFLFDTPTKYDKNDMTAKVKAISEFTSAYPKMKKAMVISPNSSYIYSEKLPDGLKLPNQSQQLDKVEKAITDTGLAYVDTVSILKNAKRAKNAPLLFYKTDHHWTTRGAYAVFEELALMWKLDTTKVKHAFYTVSESFEGTLGSKAGVHNTKDSIEICVPAKSLGTYVVNYESQQKKKVTLFENEKLEQKNHYEVFLGGNYDKVIISTTSLTNNSLLIVKDSYANCLIPMLTAHFSKIVVVDPRYLTDSMQAIMKENDFTHILFLYNLNTFLEDTSIVDALSD